MHIPKIICHRGLLDDTDRKLENHPDQIQKCIDLGFEAEIDLRIIDSKFYLGHDKPTYEINEKWLNEYYEKLYNRSSNHLWIHAKNFEAVEFLANETANMEDRGDFNSFFHDQDPYVYTSMGYVWTFPDANNRLGRLSIGCLPERVKEEKGKEWKDLEKCFRVCTDFGYRYKEYFEKLELLK